MLRRQRSKLATTPTPTQAMKKTSLGPASSVANLTQIQVCLSPSLLDIILTLRPLTVVTRCSHYFCSACAIKRFAKTPKCAACGTPTGGIFNRADKIIEKMREKQKAKEEKEREEGDVGPDVEMEGRGKDGSGEDDKDEDGSE